MTKEELLKTIMEGELFKTIDQSADLDYFIRERMNYHQDFNDDPKYKGLEREKERMEAEFISLYANPEIGRKKVNTYSDINTGQYAIMERAMFEAGFVEGVALILACPCARIME